MLRTSLSLALAALLLAAVPDAYAQNALGERVIRSWTDNVKLEDGSRADWTFTITYDADAGEYVRTVTNETGAVVERTVKTASLVRPTDEEIEMARAIILGDSELGRLYDQADNPTLSGGFVLLREEGHPCGPGSRCLQFDMFNVDQEARLVERLRYVVVDVRDGTLVSADFDPSTGGNETRFNRNSPNR